MLKVNVGESCALAMEVDTSLERCQTERELFRAAVIKRCLSAERAMQAMPA